MEDSNALNQIDGGQENNCPGESNATSPDMVHAPASRRGFMRAVLGVAAGVAVGKIVEAPEALAQLGSPTLVMPPEIRSKEADKTLHGVMELFSGKFDIPNVGNAKPLRQFRGCNRPLPVRR